MSQIFWSLSIILLISGQTTTSDIDIFTDITTKGLLQCLYEWGMKIYATMEQQKNPDKSKENIETLMNQVAEVSSKLDALETHLDIKLDTMLNTLLTDIRLEGSLTEKENKLSHCFTKIDRYFNESRCYKIGGSFGNQTLIDFSHKVLWSAVSVPDLLNDLHEIFISNGEVELGFLTVLLQRTMLNLLHDCDTGVSAQQKVYYIFIQLIIIEIKGLMVQQQSQMIQRWFDTTGYNYNSEMNIAKTNFQTRLREYHALFTREITQFPLHLRRCEGNPPARGVNFLELDKFSRIAIVDTNFTTKHGCYGCPSKSDFNKIELQTNTTIKDCKQLGKTITACPAESSSPHEYLWWRDEDGKRYGPDTPCTKTVTISGGTTKSRQMGRFSSTYHCSVFAISMEMNNVPTNDASAIGRISVTSQFSDYWKNKVVTGVRFVTQDNALHLQIQQAQFSHSGMIYSNSGWKDLDLGYYNAGINQVKTSMQYEPLRHDRKSLYLDDIKVPEGCVVTGVRFQLVDDTAFRLQIFITEFELGTGNLFPFGSTWIDASTHPMRPDDYKQPRVEINMGESNDPTRVSEFKYDLKSNKLIKFTHTDINKDAGQTTIPLIDSQSVEAQPSFPLGGIGITFRGRDGFGGYIAPRIYTLSVENYIKFLRMDSNGQTTTERAGYDIHTLDEEPNSHENSGYYTMTV